MSQCIRSGSIEFNMGSNYNPPQSFFRECQPIHSNEELLNFCKRPTIWSDLAYPLASRCVPVLLGDDFRQIQMRDRTDRTPDFVLEVSRPKVFVCHDLAGNYRDDRFTKGSRKWDDYRFYHWAGIDYFCYFSQNYITIPTLPWINAAHKNGVAILGTIIVYDGSVLSSILGSETYMRSIVDALVGVTRHCQFDGWFFNVLTPVNREEVLRLEMLLRMLTHRIHEDIPGGKVFWNNSLTTDGSLKIQSELNGENIMFMYFNVCDGIFINTAWNLENLEQTQRILCVLIYYVNEC